MLTTAGKGQREELDDEQGEEISRRMREAIAEELQEKSKL
jgi:hypothetical protein